MVVSAAGLANVMSKEKVKEIEDHFLILTIIY
ncbi:MAG: hypothetical protein K0Q74_1572 [Gammaproteobacteria bacterium]|jgi:hypothetical protein|nr:hypothetical protein [Gammaproteobacteria bacterium]